MAEAIDPQAIDTACARIAGAGRVVLYGCGREGLQLRGFAMRLYHLGLAAAYQGEMTTPPPGPALTISKSPGPTGGVVISP